MRKSVNMLMLLGVLLLATLVGFTGCADEQTDDNATATVEQAAPETTPAALPAGDEAAAIDAEAAPEGCGGCAAGEAKPEGCGGCAAGEKPADCAGDCEGGECGDCATEGKTCEHGEDCTDCKDCSGECEGGDCGEKEDCCGKCEGGAATEESAESTEG